MPRRKGKVCKREVIADPVYGSQLVQKLINVVMWRGKKNVARSIVYEALKSLESKSGNNDKAKALELFTKSFEKIVPLVQVRSRRVGGSVYQVPTEVTPERGQALAISWLIKAAASRSDKTMGKRLAKELLDAHAGQGGAIKKKLEVLRMADANRAFAHYAW